jgi:GNAT superfamily N-acetyltransferase
MSATHLRSVRVRPVVDDDTPGFAALNARPEIRARLGEVALAPRSRWGLIRTITVDSVFAGVTGLVQSDADEGHDVELFCAVLPEYRHDGVATEAGRLLLAVDAPPRVHARVLACISPDNLAAQELARRLGFRETTQTRRTGEIIWVQPESVAPGKFVAGSVSIVVDPVFGERLAAVAAHSPVWIADTPTNRPAAERSWLDRTQGRRIDVTTFKVVEGESLESWCFNILPTVALHFGAYDDNPSSYEAVDVFGVPPSPPLIELLATTGHTMIRNFPRGFRASRTAQAV